MRTRLRTAWTATCGSLAQAWIARSPSLIAGSSWSPENAGSSLSLSGSLPSRPNRALPLASTNRLATEAHRDGEPRRRQAQRLAGVLRRRERRAGHRAELADVVALRHLPRRFGPVLEQRDQVGALLARHVQRDEVEAVLRRRDDAGLVHALERDRLGVGIGDPRGALVTLAADGIAAAGTDRERADPGRADQLAAGEARRGLVRAQTSDQATQTRQPRRRRG